MQEGQQGAYSLTYANALRHKKKIINCWKALSIVGDNGNKGELSSERALLLCCEC